MRRENVLKCPKKYDWDSLDFIHLDRSSFTRNSTNSSCILSICGDDVTTFVLRLTYTNLAESRRLIVMLPIVYSLLLRVWFSRSVVNIHLLVNIWLRWIHDAGINAHYELMTRTSASSDLEGGCTASPLPFFKNNKRAWFTWYQRKYAHTSLGMYTIELKIYNI